MKMTAEQRRDQIMSDYLVTWTIDAENLNSPREAAQYARDAQVRPGSIATVFDVRNTSTGEITRVDLDGEDDDYVIQKGYRPGDNLRWQQEHNQ